MSSTSCNISSASCYYLFNHDAKDLFPSEDSAFVNQSLTTLMNVIDHLVVENPEALFIFDPTAFNNQCHLYALFVAQAVNQSKNVDRRFLYFSFFLSYAFLTDPKLLDRLVCKTLRVMKAEAPSKQFRRFVKDPESIRTHAARSALNQLFSEHMKKVLSSDKGALYPELAAITRADLQLPSSNGKGTLYTFPKFAGVAYLMDAISNEKIALLFKVKVMTKEGNGAFNYSNQNIQSLDRRSPVIVFEMVATGESLCYVECRDIAKRCSTHSRRNVSSKDRHKPTETCLFCSPNKVNVASYQQKFQPVLSQAKEMFLALGADFVLQNQKPFLVFFHDRDKFPQLTALFESSIPRIQSCFLSMIEPLNMSVSHVYADCAARACEDSLVIDAAYETHLTARGLL
ncbi:MAG: hypothetical protein ACM3JI_01530 [Anaerolineae bacterium]